MPHLSRLCAALAVAAFAVASVQAQHVRSVRGSGNSAPSAAARAAQAAPNPSGLRPLFPAGLTAGSGAAQSRDPIAQSTVPSTITGGTGARGFSGNFVTPQAPAPNTLVPPVAGGSAITPELLSPDQLANAAAATTVLGAGGAAGPAQYVPGGGIGFSAVDVARSFITADGNRDGEISRAEARRLTLSTMTFEEMDRNFDGVLSRGEYEDGLR